MPSLIYLQPMHGYPTAQVHSIQITRTVGALGRHVDVLLVAGSLSVEPEKLPGAVRDYYNVEFGPQVRVITMPGTRLQGLSFPFALREIMASASEGAAFYTRSYLMARRLLRYRWMHKRKVFFESHKKMGYWNKEPLEGSPYADARQRFAERNEPIAQIRRVYQQADCVFFLHKHSLALARRDLALRDAEHLWYGLRCSTRAAPTGGQGIVYAGSLSEDKLIDFLLDALDRVETDVRVSVYGGDSDQIGDLRRRVAARPCGKRLDFRGWQRPADLSRELPKYRFGVAMQEGMKVVDYLESGLTPIVSDTPAYRDVFDARHACFFRPDSPEQLAQALDHAVDHAIQPAAIRQLCDTYSVERRARKILARLE
ncbi:MAG: glycosyltransferase family 4 protein [Gemmatimonadales bacterium]|nr:glycosyltransferase family 4 protein [Gemmatimonadales bacterium]